MAASRLALPPAIETESGFHCPFLAWMFAFLLWIMFFALLLPEMVDWQNYGYSIIPSPQRIFGWFIAFISKEPESLLMFAAAPASLVFAMHQTFRR